MNNKDIYIQQLEDKLIKLEEKWEKWPTDLSIPKQIYKINKEINFLLTNK